MPYTTTHICVFRGAEELSVFLIHWLRGVLSFSQRPKRPGVLGGVLKARAIPESSRVRSSAQGHCFFTAEGLWTFC